jgi:hypothetical protein
LVLLRCKPGVVGELSPKLRWFEHLDIGTVAM